LGRLLGNTAANNKPTATASSKPSQNVARQP
jgi:hypothetical protein